MESITPKVSIKQTTVEHLDKILTPDDKIIFQCLTCETYLKPSETRVLYRQERDETGNARAEVVIQCPVCEPFVDDKVKPNPSYFLKLTREAYERKRMYERANLIMPEDVRMIH